MNKCRIYGLDIKDVDMDNLCNNCWEVDWRLKHYLFHSEGKKKVLEILDMNWKDPRIIFPKIEIPFLGLVNNNEFFPNDPCICIIEKQDPHNKAFVNFNNTINDHPNLWMLVSGINNRGYCSIKFLTSYKYINI